jgi:glycerophosphoryl diester phosphodiesterase
MKNILILFAFLTLCNCSNPVIEHGKKIVIAHRGASGYLPEHTMEAKAMAYGMGPDYIEQDVVLSKDNVPVVIHDILLDDVTDVQTKFTNRSRSDGNHYVIDFTFKELQTLNVTERFSTTSAKQLYPNRFPINTSSFRLHSLQQEIELIQGLNTSTGKKIGIYPEIKNPKFHLKEGKDISKIVLQILTDYGYTRKKDNCILQCFDADELERIRKKLHSNLYLVQLIETPFETKKLEHYATYANGIGSWYKQILDKKVNNKWTFTNLVSNAHKLNLKVHPYTFRADDLGDFDSFKEMVDVLLYQAKADGGFTDFPNKMLEIISKK